ncbi:MAG: hypothetical protein AAF709_00550 [Pseudomonadota bacterium]
MRYLVVDGMLSGTGIRDKYDGGYLNPTDIGLSANLCSCISTWMSQYEEVHYSGFADKGKVKQLDAEELRIARNIQTELPGSKVQYFSHAYMKYVMHL